MFDSRLEKAFIRIGTAFYPVVAGCFNVFSKLANIFISNDVFSKMYSNIYSVLSILMLFTVAYNIILLIADPSRNSGGKVTSELIKKIVLTVALLILTPTIFTYAFKIQEVILESNVITKFFGTDSFVDSNDIDWDSYSCSAKYDVYVNGEINYSVFTGRQLTSSIAASFFTSGDLKDINDSSHANKSKSGSEAYSATDDSLNCNSKGDCTISKATTGALVCNNYSIFKAFAKNVDDDNLDYGMLLSLLASGYMLYIMVVFCFDAAARIFKLVFFQLIAPLCISCNLLPGKDTLFKNWTTSTLKTYTSIFVRVAIISFMAFAVDFINSGSISSLFKGDGGFFIKLFVILGLFTFVGELPKLIESTFGLGDTSLKIGDKLKGAGIAGAALGGAAGYVGGVAGVGARKFVSGVGSVIAGHSFSEGAASVNMPESGLSKWRDKYMPILSQKIKDTQEGNKYLAKRKADLDYGKKQFDKIKTKMGYHTDDEVIEHRNGIDLPYYMAMCDDNEDYAKSLMELDSADNYNKAISRLSSLVNTDAKFNDDIKNGVHHDIALRKLLSRNEGLRNDLKKNIQFQNKNGDLDVDKVITKFADDSVILKEVEKASKTYAGKKEVHDAMKKKYDTLARVEDTYGIYKNK